MGRKHPQPKSPSRWPILVAAAGFFLAEVAVLAGASSPFRLPKEAAALGALCLAMALAFISAASHRSIALPRGRLTAVLLVLPVLQIASAFWSSSPTRSFQSGLLTLIWVLGTLWLSTIDDENRRRILVSAALGVALSVVVMLLQAAGISVFNFAAPFATARLSLTGLTGNPADLATASVLVIPFLLTWGEESSYPWFFRSLTILFALATLITQTLTGIAALAAVMTVWLVQQRSRTMWIRIAAVAVTVVAIALATGLGDRLQRQVERVRTGNWYNLFSARGDGWTAAGEMIRENPVLGVGAGAYTHEYYPSRLAWLSRHGGTGGREELASHFQWAHCDPLQMVAELGLPGAAWMALLGWALIMARRRSGPLLPLSVAAGAPFVFLHYPTHLAVGMVPMSLALAHVIAHDQPPTIRNWRRARIPVAVAVVAIAGAGAFWQLRRVAVDVWIGGLEMRMSIAQSGDPESRARLGAAIESRILPRLDRLGVQAPAAWRTLGRARLLEGDAKGAETAFRTSLTAWPHEDAEFYLGMSLFAQGRRNEAVAHLSRVCRTNPKLADLIGDPQLKRTVADVVRSYSTQ